MVDWTPPPPRALIALCAALGLLGPTGASAAAGGMPEPDITSSRAGGAAARVHTVDGSPVAGDVYLLMASPAVDERARVYIASAAALPTDRIKADAHESNEVARRVVEVVMDDPVAPRELTSAPGGGASMGLTYAIVHLDAATDGAFTGGLTIAATGRVLTDGYVQPISSIDKKTIAAELAGVDVMVTSSRPSAEVGADAAVRVVGESGRARGTGAPLAAERRWDRYRRWGSTRPSTGMDVVVVRHVGDVAAYLCGAGSDAACVVLERFTASQLAAPAAGDSSAAHPGGQPATVGSGAGAHPGGPAVR